MRVADSQVMSVLFGNLQRIRGRLLTAQEQIASQKRVAEPSDDPIAYGSGLAGRTQLAQAEQWIRNIQFGSQRLELADSTLTQVSSVLTRIKELAVQARSDTTGAANRATIAKEVRELHRHLMQLGNTELNGQALFAGTKTDTTPFVISSGDTVVYQGNAETHAIEVGENLTLQTTIPGSRIFSGPTTNLFDAVRDLLAAMESNNGAGIEAAIGSLDTGSAQVANAQGQIGALVNRLETSRTGLEQAADLATRTISENEDVDLAKAVSDLQRHDVALQAASSVLSRIFDTSLLNFLR